MQEYERNILEQYDVDINSTRKIRGAVLCDTDQGLYILKEMTVPIERIQALYTLYEYLETQDLCCVDSIKRNKEDNIVTIANSGEKYILKKWFSGRECDIRKPEEILEASKTLAKLHLRLPCEVETVATAGSQVDKDYERHNHELKKVREFVRRKSAKGEFEMEFLKNYSEMYMWAEMAKTMLEESKYQKLVEEAKNKKHLVHGEYNYHNIIIKEGNNGILALTNFEKFKQDIQVEDFYYFLRKVMEKYGWKERLGDNMLNAYSAVKPLSGSEVEYIKLRLVYPEKFWKTASAYYNSNKAWTSAKNKEKLEVAIRQTKEKERFLKNVFAFVL